MRTCEQCSQRNLGCCREILRSRRKNVRFFLKVQKIFTFIKKNSPKSQKSQIFKIFKVKRGFFVVNISHRSMKYTSLFHKNRADARFFEMISGDTKNSLKSTPSLRRARSASSCGHAGLYWKSRFLNLVFF